MITKQGTEHYIEFFYPGAFVANQDTKLIDSRDIKNIPWDDGAYACRFFDIKYIIEDDKLKYTTERLDSTGLYYKPGAKVMTLGQVRDEMPEETTLIRNMEGNDWDKVVFIKFKDGYGYPQPLSPNDIVL